MIYKIDNKVIIINPFTPIGNGFQGIVYKRKNKAIKIYRKLFMIDYRQEMDELLSTIPTEYIILPEKSVFNLLNKYCGYQMDYIDLEDHPSILDATKEDLCENLFQLIEDINMVSQKKVVMTDVFNNVFFNGKIYVMDSSYYYQEGRNDELARFLFRKQNKNILEENINSVKGGIYNLISKEITINKEEEKRMVDLFSDVNTFGKKLGEGETIKQYILKR